jgi:excisionase family DNA binding protein
MDDLVLTPAEVSKILKLGRTATYSAIAEGRIPSLRIGKKLLVPKAALMRLLEEVETAKDENSRWQ